MHVALRTIAVAGGLVIALAFTPKAIADETTQSYIQNALDKSSPRSALESNPLSDLAKFTFQNTGGEYVATFNLSGSIEVPSKPNDPIKFTARNGSSIFVSLPFASKAKTAELIADGAVAFDNQNDSMSSVMAKSDGSLQIASILKNANAPTTYSYQLSLPSGVKMTSGAGGNMALITANGKYLGGIAPAWARDSRGASVPTHYEVIGSTLIQVVDHTGQPYEYPIVADPWLGFDMIDHTAWNSSNVYSPTLSVFPNNWGRRVASMTTYPVGGIFSTVIGFVDQMSAAAAWSETLEKTSKPGHPNPDTISMLEQFQCHYFWVSKYEPAKESWNLDSKRPAAGLAFQLKNRCNVH